MFQIKRNQLSEDKKTIYPVYTCTGKAKKFFTKENFFATYEFDLSIIPEEILNIPLLANVLPVSWFAGFDVKVQVLDKNFYKSIQSIKKQFAEFYPIINKKKSKLRVDKIIESSFFSKEKTINNAMLFSGGVDAYTTYFRHRHENLDLITIRGADIKLNDDKQWEDVINYNSNTQIISTNKKHYITSNFREFLNFEVERLLPDLGWWGKIQHGLGLISLCAPLSFKNKYEILYIGSTRSIKMPFSPWGSMPEIDNKIQWGNLKTIHDGYNLTRLEKISFIVKQSQQNETYPPLRVCYNEFKKELNCNICEKCLRTTFALMQNNDNPQEYGLNPHQSFYQEINEKIKSGFSTEGIKFYWNEMLESVDFEKFYYLSQPSQEQKEIIFLKEKNKILQAKPIKSKSKLFKIKQKFIDLFPKTFDLYLKIRHKIS